MSRAQLTAEEMMRVIDGSGWPLYLSKTYSFSEGDQSPIELVGKDEKGDKISLVFSSIDGDLLLKSRNSKDPLSYIAGDFWLLPNLASRTGDSLVMRRKINADKIGDLATVTLVLQTTLTIHSWTGEDGVQTHGLTEVREYVAGTDYLARTVRKFVTKKLPHGIPTPPSASEVLQGLQTHLTKGWIDILASGTSGASIPVNFLPARATDSTRPFPVPQWLLREDSSRRMTVEFLSDAVLFKVEETTGDDSWTAVDEFSTANGEVSLVAAQHSLSGDGLMLCRGDATAMWQLLICGDTEHTMLESFTYRACKYVGFELTSVKADEMVTRTASWHRSLLKASSLGLQMAFKVPMLRSAAQAVAITEQLAASKWAVYLERGHIFSRGDALLDELASGADAKKCVAMGLALGMSVPIPGFVFLGGLGGAIVAAPPVMTKVARYVADQLAHRFVICEGALGDVILCKEFNHMGRSWKQAETYSFKAGEFEILPYPKGRNGECIHLHHRIVCKGRVLVVHEHISVERVGRGVHVQTDIMAGEDTVSSSSRYFEYTEGSVRERSTLQTFVPSETQVSTQFEWVEENIDDWLAEHEDQVVEEAKLLANRAQGNEELMQSSTNLLSMLESATQRSSTFSDAQSTLETLEPNSKVDMGQFLSLGQNVAADLAVQATEMSTDERKRARKYSTSVVNGLHELASGSDGVHKALSKGEMRYRHNGDESNIDEDHHIYGAQLQHIQLEGEKIVAEVSSPEEAIAALRTNPEFIREVEELALNYIEDTLCGTQIPTIAGEREWGSYNINGLAIKRFAIDRDTVMPNVGDRVSVEISGINIEFDSFKFDLDKVSFPRVKDGGLARATSTFSASVSFDVVTDADRNLTVADLRANVSIDTIILTIIRANNKWIFNKLLSFFSERVKSAVQSQCFVQIEVRMQVEEGIQGLDQKLGSIIKKLAHTISERGQNIKTQLAAEEGVADNSCTGIDAEAGSAESDAIMEGVPE